MNNVKSTIQFALVLLPLIAGCGGSKNLHNSPGTEVHRLGSLEYGLLEKGTLIVADQGVSGSGSVIFRNPLADEDNNYSLTFSLEPSGKLTLSTNADTKLNGGVNLAFDRRASDKLGVVLQVGAESYDVSPDFVGVNASTPLSVSVDVHGHGHTVIWIGEIEQEYAFTTRVAGTFWGTQLQNASLTSAAIAPAKHDEH